ncbi:MAG: M48 family metallopeptidase [Candidatus Cryptobacteroides sp.]
MADSTISTFNDPQIGQVTIRLSGRAKRLSIKVSSEGEVCIVRPRNVSAKRALSFFESKREWVLSHVETARKRQDAVPSHSYSRKEIEEIIRLASSYLPNRVRHLAQRYGFEYNAVHLKNNKSNWGSCSSKKNINLNIALMTLPRALSDYIIIHELCHLRHMNHGRHFHDILERYTEDNLQRLAADKEADLFSGGEAIEGDLFARELLERISHSAARYPVFSEIKTEMKKYPSACLYIE